MTHEDHELDAVLRRAAGAGADPLPVDLEARVRRTVAAERDRIRGRRRAVAALAALSGVAAAAAVLLQPGPAGPPAPGSSSTGPVAVDPPAADATSRRSMLAADPATLDPDVRVLDAGTAAPVVLASNDPDITIVWLLPGAAAGDTTEIPR